MKASNWQYYMIKSPQVWQQFFDTHKRVFLYGAGVGASLVYSKLKNVGISVSGIIVGEGHVNDVDSSEWLIPVLEFPQVQLQPGDGIIVTLKKESQPAIVDYLLSNGLSQRDIFCQNFFAQWEDGGVEESLCLDHVLTGRYFSEEDDLDTIGLRYGTDKSSSCHDYLKKYEFFFRRYQSCPINIMELGVFHGESLQTWENYFSMANIYCELFSKVTLVEFHSLKIA